MGEDFSGYHPSEIDKKWGAGPDEQQEDVEGGVMPVDGLQRSYIDSVAEDYDISLRYDEGKVHMYGESEEVNDFVSEVVSGEKVMEGKNHPAEFSVFSALEEDEVDRGKGAIPDGGQDYQTLADISHKHEDSKGVQESMNRGKTEQYEKIADGGEKTTGIPLAGFPGNVERSRVKDSENYMGSF
jgi:hypothetical protein